MYASYIAGAFSSSRRSGFFYDFASLDAVLGYFRAPIVGVTISNVLPGRRVCVCTMTVTNLPCTCTTFMRAVLRAHSVFGGSVMGTRYFNTGHQLLSVFIHIFLE